MFDAFGIENADILSDFESAVDRIFLDHGPAFSSIGSKGALAQSAFHLGTEALDAEDRIVYDQATGTLFYDAEGAGGKAAVLFASVGAGTVLAANDFTAIGDLPAVFG